MTRMGRPQLLQCGQFCAAPVVSKLAEMEARVLLPLGEGGPKGRMRVHFLPSPGASRRPSPKGRGTCPKQKPASILLLERTASRNLDKSVVLSIAAPSPRNWSLFGTLILRLCTFGLFTTPIRVPIIG